MLRLNVERARLLVGESCWEKKKKKKKKDVICDLISQWQKTETIWKGRRAF